MRWSAKRLPQLRGITVLYGNVLMGVQLHMGRRASFRYRRQPFLDAASAGEREHRQQRADVKRAIVPTTVGRTSKPRRTTIGSRTTLSKPPCWEYAGKVDGGVVGIFHGMLHDKIASAVCGTTEEGFTSRKIG